MGYSWRTGNTSEFWSSVTSLPIANDRTYVLLEIPLYVHKLIYQLKDLKRTDFWEMFVHHVLVIALLVASYAGNFVLVGCATLFYHDMTEIALELAKMFRYFNMQTMCDISFCVFTVMFGLCRLFYFPRNVINSTLFEGADTLSPSAWYFFNGLLLSVLALNVYWFKIVTGVAYRVLWAGSAPGAGRPGRRGTLRSGESTDFETESDATDDSDSYLSDFSDSGWHAKAD